MKVTFALFNLETAAEATPFAIDVFPVPGGPTNKIIPCNGTAAFDFICVRRVSSRITWACS